MFSNSFTCVAFNPSAQVPGKCTITTTSHMQTEPPYHILDARQVPVTTTIQWALFPELFYNIIESHDCYRKPRCPFFIHEVIMFSNSFTYMVFDPFAQVPGECTITTTSHMKTEPPWHISDARQAPAVTTIQWALFPELFYAIIELHGCHTKPSSSFFIHEAIMFSNSFTYMVFDLFPEVPSECTITMTSHMKAEPPWHISDVRQAPGAAYLL